MIRSLPNLFKIIVLESPKEIKIKHIDNTVCEIFKENHEKINIICEGVSYGYVWKEKSIEELDKVYDMFEQISGK